MVDLGFADMESAPRELCECFGYVGTELLRGTKKLGHIYSYHP